MDNSSLVTQNMMEDNSVVWMNQETLDIVFVFANKGGLDHIFTNEGPLSD